MDSIAKMNKQPPRPTPESRRISAAIDKSEMKKAALADAVGVTPSAVSQWASGNRPVPADKAPKLARLLGLDPSEVSVAFRQVSESSHGSAVPIRADAADDQGLAIARMQNDIHALNLALGAFAAAMVTHRPAEALDAAAALRRQVPKKYREQGLVKELTELLERASR